jgi:hypothetical protein
MTLLKRLIKEQDGMESVEWVIMGGVIIVGIAFMVGFLVLDIRDGMNALSDEVQLATSLGKGAAS